MINSVGKHKLRHAALKAIAGVGDKDAGEWHEWTGRTYHVRRRLTPDEQKITGPALDVRGTPEALKRIHRVRSLAPYVPLRDLLAES